MIKAYTASPVEIERIDSKKARTGNGASRYAEGMYFGDANTANHYLDVYKNYTGASSKYEYKGSEILPGAKILTAIKALDKANFDVNKAIASLDGDPESQKHLELLEEQSEQSLKTEISVTRGIAYGVTLKGVDIKDLPLWDDNPNLHDILELAFIMAERLRKRGLFDGIDYDEAGIEISNDYDAESIIDAFYDQIYYEASENGMGAFDDTELKEVFLFRLFGDYDIRSNLHYEAEELENTDAFKYLDKLNLSAFFNINSEMTYGDLYRAVASSIKDIDKVDYDLIDSRKMASEILSKEFNIPGFLCDAQEGFEDSMEIVIIDESVLKNSKFEEIDRSEFNSIVNLETEPMYPKNPIDKESLDNDDWENSYSRGY